MVSNSDSIIYVPRDRRRKVDVRHLEAHHFHNLLLVSKSFITPDEFAFAILTSAKLTFYSYNELRRLTTEVPSSFKESIRYIHLSRTYFQGAICTDTFNGFSSIEKTLSTHMPQLCRIYISWPGYCAQVALCEISHTPSLEDQDTMFPSIVEDVLAEKPKEEMEVAQVVHRNSPSHVVASFLGDRATAKRGAPGSRGLYKNWTRPLGWIRRLMSYAEDKDIEVVLQMNICIAYVHRISWLLSLPTNESIPTRECWSTSGADIRCSSWQTHVEAEMSSRDYMLRVERNGRKFAYHQKLAYDMLHSPGNKGMKYWFDMVEEVGPRRPSHMFLHDDGF